MNFSIFCNAVIYLGFLSISLAHPTVPICLSLNIHVNGKGIDVGEVDSRGIYDTTPQLLIPGEYDHSKLETDSPSIANHLQCIQFSQTATFGDLDPPGKFVPGLVPSPYKMLDWSDIYFVDTLWAVAQRRYAYFVQKAGEKPRGPAPRISIPKIPSDSFMGFTLRYVWLGCNTEYSGYPGLAVNCTVEAKITRYDEKQEGVLVTRSVSLSFKADSDEKSLKLIKTNDIPDFHNVTSIEFGPIEADKPSEDVYVLLDVIGFKIERCDPAEALGAEEL